MTQLEQYLLDPQNRPGREEKFIIPRFGDVAPITLKPISNADYQNAMLTTTKLQKDGSTKRDIRGFLSKICLLGITNPNPSVTDYIEMANNNIAKENADLAKRAEEEYKEECNKWEKNGSDPEEKPKKRVLALQKELTTPQDLLEYWFLAGEISQIADKILEISGFGITLEKAIDDSKN